jgi:RNA polymerase sigma-70 factor (ECF subfamily)
MSDLELAREVAGGGERSVRALGELFVRHSSVLLRFARRLCKGEHEAEDLVHDVFVRVAETVGTFRGDSSFRTWLFSLALNRARSRRRRSALEPEKNQQAVQRRTDVQNDPAAAAEQRELLQKVDEAIDKLNDDERETFELYWFGKLSYAEICEVTGISVSAAKVRVHRALAKLSVLLEGVR